MANSIHGLSNLDSIGQPTLLFTAAAIRNSDLLNGLQIDTLTSSQITQLQARAGHFDTPIAAVHQRCLDAAGGAQQNVTGNRAPFILTAGADALTDADIALVGLERDVATGIDKLLNVDRLTGNDAQVTPGPHALQVNLASNFKAQITACFGNTC